jgi:hypothetical protein
LAGYFDEGFPDMKTVLNRARGQARLPGANEAAASDGQQLPTATITGVPAFHVT